MGDHIEGLNKVKACDILCFASVSRISHFIIEDESADQQRSVLDPCWLFLSPYIPSYALRHPRRPWVRAVCSSPNWYTISCTTGSDPHNSWHEKVGLCCVKHRVWVPVLFCMAHMPEQLGNLCIPIGRQGPVGSSHLAWVIVPPVSSSVKHHVFIQISFCLTVEMNIIVFFS